MGTVVLSVDAELGWGFHDLSDPPTDRIANARQGWRRLLDLCDRYEVPSTWAVVGHLMLEDCDGRHADHPAPADWFDHERGPDAMARALRFGDGLVEAIREASVDHDVGLHTFSHVEFGDPDTTRPMARAEVAAGLEAARARGFEPASFVFPRNRVGHLDVLASYGLSCYRGNQPGETTVSRPRKLAEATVVPSTPPLVTPREDAYGLVNVPASLYLFSFEGLARRLVEPVFGDPVVRRARRGIDAAAERDGVFHMWLHPNNLTDERDARRLAEIFEYLEEKREASPLSVETMAEVAAETEGEPGTAHVEPS